MNEEKSAEGQSPTAQETLARRLTKLDDGALMRWAFVGVLLAASTMLGMDLRDLAERNGGFWPSEDPEAAQHAMPVLPPAVDAGGNAGGSADPRRFVTAEHDVLRQPISFTLEPGGLLRAVGSIDLGAAARLEKELEARGEYVKLVSLNSPGGALEEAMAMARMLRERGVGTRVEDGAICASSCPLLFAGGVTRETGSQAAVGLHQFYTAADATHDPAQAMANAQMTTARISRHLAEMGVDPALWLHALDTPPRELYYLSEDQLQEYRLTWTEADPRRR